jgi:hypothetical protein
MSNTITITTELCKEDRQRLDELIAFAGLLVGELKDRAPVTATAPQETPKAEPVTEDTPAANTTTVATPEPVTEPAAPKWTKADLQTKVQALAAPGTGKRDKVREIVKSYAEKVGDIPADKYDEVMDKLIALEQEVV